MPVIQCQLCGRSVKPGQTTCKCGSVIPESFISGDDESIGRFDWGVLLPWVPVAGAVLLLFWLISPPVALYYSVMPVFKMYAVIVLLSSALALVAADRLRKQGHIPKSDSPLAQLAPQGWFPLLIVAWPVAFPAFLRLYYDDEKPDRVRNGYITSGIYLFLVFLVPFIIKGSLPEWSGDTETGTDPVVQQTPTPATTPVPSSRWGNYIPPATAPSTPTPAVSAGATPQPAPSLASNPVPNAPPSQPVMRTAVPARQPVSRPNGSNSQNSQPSRQSFGVSGLPGVD